MKIVITGPTGPIGHALIEECIQLEYEVLAICNKGSKRNASLPKSELVQILELSLSEYDDFNEEQITKLGKAGYDIFFHLAWTGTIGNVRDDTKVQHDNIGYALSAVKLAKRLGCHTFVGAGSQAEYGIVDGKISANTYAAPFSGYGIAKLCASQMTRLLCNQIGMKHIWARILSVYGPYDGPNTMISSTIVKLLNGEVPKFTKSEQEWDYLYCSDAASAMLAIGIKGVNGKVYPIGSGQTRPLSEYIKIMRDAIDPNLPLDIGANPYSPNQVMYLCADIEELQKDTGFQVKVSFEEGIANTIAALKENRG